MKDNKRYKEWMLLAAEKLNYTEYRVFSVWFDDAESFSAGASRLHILMPFIARQNIHKALRGLVKKGFLVSEGKKNGRIFFKLSVLPESSGIQAPIDYESVEIPKESARTQKESSQIQKIIPTDARTYKNQKNKEEREPLSSGIPLVYNSAVDPDFNPDEPWKPTLARIKVTYAVKFNEYLILGDGYKNLVDDFILFSNENYIPVVIDQYNVEEVRPDKAFIVTVISELLKARFKRNDKSAVWSFDGPICQDILGRILGHYDRITAKRPHINPPIPMYEKLKLEAMQPNTEDQDFLNQFLGVSEDTYLKQSS